MSIFMKSNNNKIDLESKKNKMIIFLILAITLFVISVFSILIGSATITFDDVIKYFSFQELSSNKYLIIDSLRIPRLIGGVIVGASLAASGFILQVVLNNSLASPSTIGVNSGSALFVIIGAGIFSSTHTNIWAFFGALIAVLIVVLISYVSSASRITIILTGITVSAICSGLIDLITIFNIDVVYDKTAFFIGGLGTVNKSDIVSSLPFLVIACILMFIFKESFGILVLGDEIAHSLGVNVVLVRIVAIIVVALLASTATNIAGLIGFVGIITPHIVRRVMSGDVKILIIISALLGAILVVFADTLGRVIVSPYEIPVGVILALTGGPFFISLLLSSSKRGQML